MRKRLIASLIIILAGMLVVPAINALQMGHIPWLAPDRLYRIDFLRSTASWMLRPFGMSMKPGDAIIGREGWFFLGDEHDRSITNFMREADAGDRKHVEASHKALAAWDLFLKDHGVSLFRVMVGPNKSSIYPEMLPAWMRPASLSGTDALLAERDDIIVDLRPALIAAKRESAYPIYYQTDTHWNALGASLAFRAFAREVSKQVPGLRWPDESNYVAVGMGERTGGDLSKLLGLPESLLKEAPVVSHGEQDFRSIRSDWQTGKILYDGPLSIVGMSRLPMLIQTRNALNNRRVLWLRDSFGTGLSPLMTATFSDVLQDHWMDAFNPEVLPRLVERFKPDYVFMTVVERNLANPILELMPPVLSLPEDRVADREATASVLQWSNDVQATQDPKYFKVTGQDPYMSFHLAAPLDLAGHGYVHLPLKCDGGAANVSLQLFWQTEANPDFSEQRSVRFMFDTGLPVVSLQSLGIGPGEGKLTGFRVDINDPGACRGLWLEAPAFFEQAGLQ